MERLNMELERLSLNNNAAPVPCRCPIPGCGYSGVFFHGHLRAAHPQFLAVSFSPSWEATLTLRRRTPSPCVLLMHEHDRDDVFVLLHGWSNNRWSWLKLHHVGPGNRDDLVYTMDYRAGYAGSPEAQIVYGFPLTRWDGTYQRGADYRSVPGYFWNWKHAPGRIAVYIKLTPAPPGREEDSSSEDDMEQDST